MQTRSPYHNLDEVEDRENERYDSQAAGWLSVLSNKTGLSMLRLASFGSILSSGSAGSLLSIGSAGSILSIGSTGSILSSGRTGGMLSIGGVGTILEMIGNTRPAGACARGAGAIQPTKATIVLDLVGFPGSLRRKPAE